MKKVLILLSLVYFTAEIFAQELNCKVQVLAQRATTTDQQVFKTLETAIFEFMNNRKWTQDVFANNERIECSIFLNITDDDGSGKFSATATIQSSRPVFNSSYNSVVFNHADQQWRFEYVQFQPLIFTEGVYTDNLSALLSFYAYLIIGLDYDSYALKGGSLYLQKAQEVVNVVPQNGEYAGGWRQADGNLRNRYWIIENVLNPRFEVFRKINYEYHRLAMDKMYDDTRTARTMITAQLKSIEPIFSSNPNAMVLQMFFAAKQNEFINLYSKASPQEKAEAVNLLTKYDPVNGQKYNAISGSK
jgi:hypothetical protein